MVVIIVFLGHIFGCVNFFVFFFLFSFFFCYHGCCEHKCHKLLTKADAMLLSEKSKSITNLRQFGSTALNSKCDFVPVKDE